jgi:RNA ligase-like protein
MSQTLEKARKPLGRKNYGSVPHFSGSRVGPGDWHIPDGQARIACAAARDRQDRVIVTEKLDGSNVGVARIGQDIVPLMRAGYRAKDSRYPAHHFFAEWVSSREQRFSAMLADGERIVGEWLLLAHATRYKLESADDLFVAFDLMAGERRLSYDELVVRSGTHGLRTAALLSDGPALPIAAAMEKLGKFGYHGALDLVEGAVWRVERNRQFEFMAKFVRPEKVDGALLPEISGQGPIWNWPFDRL